MIAHASFPKRSAQPDRYPVSLDALKRPLGYEDTDDAAIVEQLRELRKAATEMVEKDSRRAFVSGTWTLKLDEFCGEIELRVAPVSAVGSITYVDFDGTTQTLSASLYQTDLVSEPARICPAYGELWPQTKSDTLNTVTVTFTAGYTSDTLIPGLAVEAIKLAVYQMFNGCELGDNYWALIDRLRWDGGLR